MIHEHSNASYPALCRPWESLRQMRRTRGLTQAQLANGIIAQATLSQIESGRANPTKAVLTQLYERLGASPEDFFTSWSVYRRRRTERAALWRWFQLVNRHVFASVYPGDMSIQPLSTKTPEFLRDMLQQSSLLTPMENLVYRAYMSAMEQNWITADQELWELWRQFGEDFPLPAKGAKLRQGQKRRNQESEEQKRNRELTYIERSRLLIVVAQTQQLIAQGLGRTIAADYWRAVSIQKIIELSILPDFRIQESHDMV